MVVQLDRSGGSQSLARTQGTLSPISVALLTRRGNTRLQESQSIDSTRFGMHVHGVNLTVCSIDTDGVAAAWNQQNPLSLDPIENSMELRELSVRI